MALDDFDKEAGLFARAANAIQGAVGRARYGNVLSAIPSAAQAITAHVGPRQTNQLATGMSQLNGYTMGATRNNQYGAVGRTFPTPPQAGTMAPGGNAMPGINRPKNVTPLRPNKTGPAQAEVDAAVKDLDNLRSSNGNMPAHRATEPSASATRPTWSSVKQYAAPVAGAVGIASVGASMYNGGRTAAEQDARTQDLMANRVNNLNAPPPSMTVTASYEEFAQDKLAAPMNQNQYAQTFHASVAKSLGDTFSERLIGKPLDTASEILKKKLYTEPKEKAIYQAAVEGDPHLQKFQQENPEQLKDAHKTLTKFAPSLAADKNATRSFLRQAMMAGGQMDFATIRLLAETEKFIQNSKGRGFQA